mmetsp:Transcript_32979/g.83196  ORF Transcript_32979/g.83196 Transcript_32979/m.83196 type:complete len:246 (-) Transcript_32979:394-1131(-)
MAGGGYHLSSHQHGRWRLVGNPARGARGKTRGKRTQGGGQSARGDAAQQGRGRPRGVAAPLLATDPPWPGALPGVGAGLGRGGVQRGCRRHLVPPRPDHAIQRPQPGGGSAHRGRPRSPAAATANLRPCRRRGRPARPHARVRVRVCVRAEEAAAGGPPPRPPPRPPRPPSRPWRSPPREPRRRGRRGRRPRRRPRRQPWRRPRRGGWRRAAATAVPHRAERHLRVHLHRPGQKLVSAVPPPRPA